MIVRLFYSLLLFCICLVQPLAFSATVNKEHQWPNHSTLVVWFLNGDINAQNLVTHTANQWARFTNLSFEFVSEKPVKSHIRILFDNSDGTILGKHENLKGSDPTMYLKSVSSPKIKLDIKRRIILHEFGHSLGFEHEYRHPNWPYGNEYIEFKVNQCLDEQKNQVNPLDCKNMHQTLMKDSIHLYPFDDQSIMNYPIDSSWLENRHTPIKTITKLSDMDKIAAMNSYPIKTRSVEQNRSFLFQNQCAVQVIVKLKYKNKKQIKSAIESIWLKPFSESQWFHSTDRTMSFSAKDQSRRYKWPASNEINEWEINLPFDRKEPFIIPLFCNS